MRGRVAATAMAGVMGITAAPAAAWALTGVPADVAVDAPAVDGDHHDVLGAWLGEQARTDALVVVTPGTDDTGLFPRVNGLVAGRDAIIVRYPESFGPFVSGRSGHVLPFLAPGYDRSRAVAVDHNLAIMRLLDGADRVVVYTGFSQGADALGNAAEQAVRDGLLRPGANENVLIVLVSDPRGPWGLKSRADRIPFAGPVLGLAGVSLDGARDPADTGSVKVVQVIVQGDPVAHTQWNPLRPVSSVLVNAAGFLTIHASNGKYTYAHLENLEKTTYYSVDGNTTYEVYDTYHPLALLNLMVAESLGMDVDEETLNRWDRQAEAFYPTQTITPETADPGVKVTRTPGPAHTQTVGRHRAPETDVDTTSGPVAEPDVESDPAGDAGTGGRHRLVGPDGRWADAPTGDTAASGEAADDQTGGDQAGGNQTGGNQTGGDAVGGETAGGGPRHAAPETETETETEPVAEPTIEPDQGVAAAA